MKLANYIFKEYKQIRTRVFRYGSALFVSLKVLLQDEQPVGKQGGRKK